MRITVAIMLITALHVSATGVGQTVSYSGRKVKLEAVFTAIEQQTGYGFFYKLPDLRDTKPVTVDLKDVPIEEALEKVLRHQDLHFSIQGNTIFVTLKSEPLPAPMLPEGLAAPPPIVIRGAVYNESGKPLAGAVIRLRDARGAAVADDSGHFTITIPSGDRHPVLVISYVGYATQEIAVEKDATISVQLRLLNKSLDQVVVVGYNTVKKSDVTGSVVSIGAEEIRSRPVVNALQALQGKAAGVDVTSNERPGESGTVLIRGARSLTASNTP
ncbi:MAG: carboxypeptidase-like regulatory domain-containing protein, partial [Chitinophaga rupis]